jgi:hypothetical protein
MQQVRNELSRDAQGSLRDLIDNIPIVMRASFAGARQQVPKTIFPVGGQVGLQFGLNGVSTGGWPFFLRQFSSLAGVFIPVPGTRGAWARFGNRPHAVPQPNPRAAVAHLPPRLWRGQSENDQRKKYLNDCRVAAI